ncbi:ABC transporter permease [Phytopseudomonas dryadis]|uniref:ABC transporter permease n=1 Tax=Phytopseudomonas dryadis TaxID=2487520 RepID=UPI0013F15DCD|nr:ABC transporter permease [Pseudomonas dryadis]
MSTVPHAESPGARIWRRFKRHRIGYWSLWLFLGLYGLSLIGELVSNDRPLFIHYQGEWYFPLFKDYPEAVFGGQLPTLTDYLDPFIRERLAAPGNFALYPPNPYYYDTLNYFSTAEHFPGPPSAENWLGLDAAGYDMTARLLYGFRISVTFALALTLIGTLLGIAIGALQGYFAGKVDLIGQRLIEIWSSMPELYLLIIFASMFNSSFILIFILLSLFSWMQLSDYVRVEFLRNRQLEYVKSARALGLSSGQIIWRHVLPNSMTPVITFLPFRMSAGIMALASLDFLGLGVSSPAPSLGNLLAQGKQNLDAWWISLATFTVLVGTLLMLTFMGEALRDALDNRIADEEPEEEDERIHLSRESAQALAASGATDSAPRRTLLEVS